MTNKEKATILRNAATVCELSLYGIDWHVAIDRARTTLLGLADMLDPPVTPGRAAFDIWAPHTDHAWENLTTEGRAMWESIAKAARDCK